MSVASSTDGSKLVAAAYYDGIYTSTNSGVSWTKQAVTDEFGWISVASSADGMKLVAVAEDTTDVYTSTDGGVNWTIQAGPTEFGWASVTSSADGNKLAAVTGQEVVYTSSDSGATWTPQAGSGSHFWWAIASSADGSVLAAVVSAGHVHISTDSGETWTEISDAGQQQWRTTTVSADGSSIFAAARGGSIARGAIDSPPDTTPDPDDETGGSTGGSTEPPAINQDEIPVPNLIVPLTPIRQILSTFNTPTTSPSTNTSLPDSQEGDVNDSRDIAMNQSTSGDENGPIATSQETTKPADDGGNFALISTIASSAVLATIAYLLFRRRSADNQ
jgi:hypothetical protein